MLSVSYVQMFCSENFFRHGSLLVLFLLPGEQHPDDDWYAEDGGHGADGQLRGGKQRAGDKVAEQAEGAAAQEAARDDHERLRGAEQILDEMGHCDADEGYRPGVGCYGCRENAGQQDVPLSASTGVNQAVNSVSQNKNE